MRSSAKFTHRVLLRRSYPFLKFAYFLKSTRYYSKRIWTNLSSDKAFNIQGEYEHLFQYTARKYINGSLTQKEFERKFLYRQQNEKAKIDFLWSFANLMFSCVLLLLYANFAFFCLWAIQKTWYEVDFRWNTDFVHDFSYFGITVNWYMITCCRTTYLCVSLKLIFPYL